MFIVSAYDIILIKKLDYVNISNNEVKDLSSLKSLKKLETIMAESIGIDHKTKLETYDWLMKSILFGKGTYEKD